MIRLFAALAIPDGVAQSLAPSQCGIVGARWRPAEALHVTLRFFGDVTEVMAEDLDIELAKVTGKPLTLSLSGVGDFDEGDGISLFCFPNLCFWTYLFNVNGLYITERILSSRIPC